MMERRCRPSANAGPTEAILFNYIVSKQVTEDEADWANRDSQGSGGPIPPVWWFSASVGGLKVWQSRIGPSAFAVVQLNVATSTGLINSSSNSNDPTIPTFVPFAAAVHFVFAGHGKSPAPPLRITAVRSFP
jgi:hypothetical protein